MCLIHYKYHVGKIFSCFILTDYDQLKLLYMVDWMKNLHKILYLQNKYLDIASETLGWSSGLTSMALIITWLTPQWSLVRTQVIVSW